MTLTLSICLLQIRNWTLEASERNQSEKISQELDQNCFLKEYWRNEEQVS